MMNQFFLRVRCVALLIACGSALSARAQTANDSNLNDRRREFDGTPSFGADGFGPRGFGAGGPGPMPEQIKLLSRFDRDGNHRLDVAERKAAREFLAQERTNRPAHGLMGRPPFGFGREEDQSPPQSGPKLAPPAVKSFPDAPLYDAKTLRTLFLEFENADWEKELSDFHNTDVEVTAKLTVDGKVYPNVGVHFRGASSYMMVGEGRKRSLNVSLDFADENQRLYGYRTLNLLNSHEDATFLRTVLFSHIAGEYVPTPKANFVRVVINGECWGIYVNQEQFNKDFVKENFGTTKGARWKAPGSPQGRAGLEYLGEDAAAYKKIYEIKSKDDAKSWTDLIQLCKVLNETPANRLEAALALMLDVDGALKFLALEMTFINNDGYWIRASDYSLYEDTSGRFHVLPHDMNETFSLPGGPGFGGGRRGGGGESTSGVELDPLTGLNDAGKPLRSKLLAVPALREKYLSYVRELAEQWLDWQKLGPLAAEYQALITDAVKADTRKLDSTESFFSSVTNSVPPNAGVRRGPPQISLKSFAEQRRAYLLKPRPKT
ncbi:MAG: spore coat protein CotH [Verrucomicrobia bacterium]|nr:MAG: spore coat protein CotH [Verrucomicrobiota bacterium]